MNTLLIMDIVILGFGVYMLFVCYSMKKSGKIHSVLLAESELKKCKHQKEFVQFMTPRLFIFSIITLIDGVIGIVAEQFVTSRYLDFVYMIIFFAAFIWFSCSLKKAREKFC